MINISRRPLIIGGCPRSGTNMLMHWLNEIPGVTITVEENLPDIVRKMGYLFSKREVMATTKERPRSDREPRSNLATLRFHLSGAWIPELVFLAYQKLHEDLNGGTNLVLWGDKFPHAFRQMPAFWNQYPEAMYIHITRHPFDVVESMIRRTKNTQIGKDTWNTATIVPEMIREWRCAWQFRQTYEGDARCLFVHYEGLLFGSEDRRISEFIGVDLPRASDMVADPKKHFQRPNLNGAIVRAIRRLPEFSTYSAEIKALVLAAGPNFASYHGAAKPADLARLCSQRVQDFARRVQRYRAARHRRLAVPPRLRKPVTNDPKR